MPPRLRLPFAIALLVPAVGSWTPSSALACPDCLAGRLARASVFDSDFAANLVAISSPLVVLAAIVAWLYRIDRAPRPRVAIHARRGRAAEETSP